MKSPGPEDKAISCNSKVKSVPRVHDSVTNGPMDLSLQRPDVAMLRLASPSRFLGTGSTSVMKIRC